MTKDKTDNDQKKEKLALFILLAGYIALNFILVLKLNLPT